MGISHAQVPVWEVYMPIALVWIIPLVRSLPVVLPAPRRITGAARVAVGFQLDIGAKALCGEPHRLPLPMYLHNI